MRSLPGRLALAAAPLALALLAVGPAVASTTPAPAAAHAPAAVTANGPLPGGSTAATSTPPGTRYQMYDNTCSFGGPCREYITITSNPNNAAVRAWLNCLQVIQNTYSTVYSGWHTSVGYKMTTPSCDQANPPGRALNAGFQWNKTALYTLQCWYRGNSWGPATCSS